MAATTTSTSTANIVWAPKEKLADFTPEEQSCISSHISKKIKEGMDKDQAIAAAINICAPEKSRSKSSEDRTASLDSSIPGGNYTAVNNGDGTFDLIDVPIMAELKKGEKSTPFDVSREWLQTAVDRAKKLKDENYLAPLHVKHHDMGVQTERAGFVYPKKVEKIRYDGRESWAILADLTRIPAKIFERIQKGELPYRSVEIARWQNPEINSLALLDDDAPFFRFELLTVGNIIDRGLSQFGKCAEAEGPECGWVDAKGVASLVLFNFGGTKMSTPETKKLQEEEEKKPFPPGKEEEKKPEETNGMSQILGAVQGMMQILQMMAQKMGIAAAPMAATPAPEKIGPVEQPEAMKAKDDRVVELSAKLAAIDTKLAAREVKEKLEITLSAAVGKLKGYNLTDETKAEMRSIAENAKDAEKTLDSWVKTFKANVPSEPPNTLAEYESKAAVPGEPEIVAKFAAQGPEMAEKARKYARMHAEYVRATSSDIKVEDFIETQIAFERSRAKNGAAARR